MEQQVDAGLEKQRIGGAFEGRRVVGLGVDLAEDEVRLAQAAQGPHALEQVVGDAMHHLPDVAMDVGMQAAEIGDAGGGAHAAEKSVALDQQRVGAMAGRRRGGGDAGGSSAEHDDVVFAEHRCRSGRLFYVGGHRCANSKV